MFQVGSRCCVSACRFLSLSRFNLAVDEKLTVLIMGMAWSPPKISVENRHLPPKKLEDSMFSKVPNSMRCSHVHQLALKEIIRAILIYHKSLGIQLLLKWRIGVIGVLPSQGPKDSPSSYLKSCSHSPCCLLHSSPQGSEPAWDH